MLIRTEAAPLGGKTPTFTAVDCSNVSKVGILHIPETCQNNGKKENKGKTTEKEVFIYQEEERSLLLPYCEVKVSRTFTHCGMWSHSSQIRPLEILRPVRIQPDTCRSMFKTAKWQDDKGNNHSINVGGKTFVNFLEAGRLKYQHHEVTCQGQQVVIAGRVYDGVLTMVDAQVTAALKKAVSRKDGQTLHLPEEKITIHKDQVYNNGWQASWVSSNQGTLDLSEWMETPISACNLRVLGSMRLQVIQEEAAFSNVTVYWSEETKIYLVRKNKVKAASCGGGNFYSTNLDGLFVEENISVGKRVDRKLSRKIDMVLLMTEMSDFVVQSLRLEIQAAALHSRCLLLNHQAHTGQTSSMPGATLGQMILLGGELAVVMQCKVATATFRRTTDCFADLPVSLNGTRQFLEPISRALKRNSTRVSCSSAHQAFKDTKGRFYRAAPHLEELDTPAEEPEEQRITGQSMAGKGIYSQDALERAQKLYQWSRDRQLPPAPQQPEWQPEAEVGGYEGLHLRAPHWLPAAVKVSLALAGITAVCLIITKIAAMCGAARGLWMDLKMGALTAKNLLSTVCCTAYGEGVRQGRARREALPDLQDRRETVRKAEAALQHVRGSQVLGSTEAMEADELQEHPAAKNLAF